MSVELQGKYCRYYICEWSEGLSLGELPWGKEEFDVSILIFDQSIALSNSVKKLVEELVRRNSDWFETLGVGAERLHDEIDKAGVRAGRQKAVGDGSPMTAWFEEVTDPKQMAEHSFLGGSDNRVIVVLGTSKDFNRFVAAIKKEL